MPPQKVVDHKAWVEARKRHLAKEKEFTRLRDQLSRERRDLPWELVEKDYVFEGPEGRRTFGDLFEGRSQLVLYHAMWNPDTADPPNTTYTVDAPCFVCSWWMDNLDRQAVHLAHRDITIAAASRAPYSKIARYRERMGWSFPYYSSAGSDFNFDYGVSFTPEQIREKTVEYNYRRADWSRMTEAPGISVFFRDGEGSIYHTYSTYERGLDMLNVGYHYMDLVPKGRDEGDTGAFWVRRRDEYEG
jgi:predicted dithiol-disulfide oxidoreductase (DUF899 family)